MARTAPPQYYYIQVEQIIKKSDPEEYKRRIKEDRYKKSKAAYVKLMGMTYEEVKKKEKSSAKDKE